MTHSFCVSVFLLRQGAEVCVSYLMFVVKKREKTFTFFSSSIRITSERQTEKEKNIS
jgi:hypothetical protein